MVVERWDDGEDEVRHLDDDDVDDVIEVDDDDTDGEGEAIRMTDRLDMIGSSSQ